MEAFKRIKSCLAKAPVLALPDLNKPFDLFTNAKVGAATGVLTQERMGLRQPVAFLSKVLDPVCRGWPECVQAIAATAVLVEEGRKITFGAPMTVHIPHTVRTILLQRAGRWLTDSRILKYEAILMDRDDLTLVTNRDQNPAAFLVSPSSETTSDQLEHECLEIIDLQTKIPSDLGDEPLCEGERWFIDGSSRCIEGTRYSGYGIVDGKNGSVIEDGRLPGPWSAQTCELYALYRALQGLQGKVGTIYTDSKYAYGVVHTFGKIWKERGLITGKRQKLVHENLIIKCLDAFMLPKEVAVVHVRGHQIGEAPKPEVIDRQMRSQRKSLWERLYKCMCCYLYPRSYRKILFLPRQSSDRWRHRGCIKPEMDCGGQQTGYKF
ncbi:uncharacterized protein [Narcine bancroftii]|uniref:uncharacterized protein n=1 Tax=Narcine bancroftii TaxID=1343680 RepID=UPI003831CF92